MNSLFSKNTLEKMKNARKTFLWIAVCILIGELIVGAIMILGSSWNDTIGKIQGTFLLFAIMLFVGVNNFIRMEKGDRTIQILALVGFIANIVWLVLAVLLMWEVLPAVWYEEVPRTVYSYSYTTTISHMTIISKITLIAASIAAAGFWTSNVMAIKDTIKPVKPLKITAVICELYCCIYAIVMTLCGYENITEDMQKWAALAALAGLAFVITTLAALIISKVNKKEKATSSIQGNAEVQATIQEMVEKEVRARMAAAQGSQSAPLDSTESATPSQPANPIPSSIYPEVKKDDNPIINHPEDGSPNNGQSL